jgi:hypothetical protein
MPAKSRSLSAGSSVALLAALSVVLTSCMTVRPVPFVSPGPPPVFKANLKSPAAAEPVEVAALSAIIHSGSGSCVIDRLAVGPVIAKGDEGVSTDTAEQLETSEIQVDDDALVPEVIDEAFLERLLTGPPLEPVIEEIAEVESAIVPPPGIASEDEASEDESTELDEDTAEATEESEDEDGEEVASEEEEEESLESVRGRLAQALARLQALTAPAQDNGPEVAEEPESQEITPAEALAAFECISPRMREAYASAGHRPASEFFSWHRRSEPPFRAVRLNHRYVSIFVNEHAFNDSPFLLERRVPIGAALALPGFIVDENGVVQISPLLLLEKMPRGFDSPRGNWRYTQISAAGEIVGTTKGKSGDLLQFCIECDALAADAAYRSLLNGEVFSPEAEDVPELEDFDDSDETELDETS